MFKKGKKYFTCNKFDKRISNIFKESKATMTASSSILTEIKEKGVKMI